MKKYTVTINVPGGVLRATILANSIHEAIRKAESKISIAGAVETPFKSDETNGARSLSDIMSQLFGK